MDSPIEANTEDSIELFGKMTEIIYNISKSL